uniref:Polynucleotidyl transferase, Ribonuclease H fold n=1 Tax=Medicago truncatula TaxID=3880 RepID=A2Q5G9_MEDTR|nr:Polynucleotidyl transferase, Ribonuclease H fold [Medicago truncatula]
MLIQKHPRSDKHVLSEDIASGILNTPLVTQVPPKIENLVWRICRGVLPTRIRLQDKGVQCRTNCVSCEHQAEDIDHVFFHCPFAVQAWNSARLWQQNGTCFRICLRDKEGAYMLAKTMSFSPMVSVNIGEALTLFHAPQWLQDMRFDNVDFVVDSKITADAVISRRSDVTEFGQIIAACQDMISSYLYI